MKKIALFFIFCSALSIAAFADGKLRKPISKKEISKKKSSAKPGRECCTKTIGLPGAGTYSVTACSGWLFSNSAAAQARACVKAQDRLLKFFTQPHFEIAAPDAEGYIFQLSRR